MLAQARPTRIGVSAVVLLVVAFCSCALHNAHAQAISAAPTATAKAGRARCRMQIEGSSNGRIKTASVSCSGGHVVTGVHGSLLPFLNSSQPLSGTAGGFQGVVVQQTCAILGCLLTICGDTRVLISDSTLQQVRTANITLCVRDSASVVLHGTRIRDTSGSAVVAFNRSMVVLDGRSVVSGNVVVGTDPARRTANSPTPVYAAGVSAVDDAHVIITGHSVVVGNAAKVYVDGLGSQSTALYYQLINYEAGQQGWWNGASGVIVRDRARMEVTGKSSITNNTAEGDCGGGVVAGNGSLLITGGSIVAWNRASVDGGGLCVRDRGNLTVQGSSMILGNMCGLWGCGVFVDGSANATIQGPATIRNNGRLLVVDCDRQCVSERDSMVRRGRGGGGGLAVKDVATVLLEGPVVIAANLAYARRSGDGVHASGNSRLLIKRGVNFTQNSASRAQGQDIATTDNAFLFLGDGVWSGEAAMTICSPTIALGSNICPPGTFRTTAVGCACCSAYTYDFSREARLNGSCSLCPDNALCRENTILPVAGYWHSSERSVQIHRCPLFTTSCGVNGTCNPSFTGPLCGSCASGYGLTLPFKCGKCLDPHKQLLLYAGLFMVSVALIALTVHATWVDNRSNKAGLRVSDVVKVLVQFLQYLVILASISVPWPSFLVSCFSAASVVFGAASGQSSLDCWVKQYFSDTRIPSAIVRELVLFISPLFVLAAVMLLLVTAHWLKKLWYSATLRHGHLPRLGVRKVHALQLISRLRVALIVVVFYAYPTLVKASLSFFACLRIDDADKQPYPEYAVLNRTAGYWVSDIQQECYAGWHKAWAFGLGLPAVLLLCFGVPVGLWWFLWANVKRASEASFEEIYGFLYRNYKSSTLWWDAVWSAQTVLLTLLSVFHHSIGAWHALLLMCLFLFLSASLQQWKRPYTDTVLHRLHLAATQCLLLNIWLAMNLYYNTNTAANMFLGAAMVLVNFAFVSACVIKIVQLARTALQQPLQSLSRFATQLAARGSSSRPVVSAGLPSNSAANRDSVPIDTTEQPKR